MAFPGEKSDVLEESGWILYIFFIISSQFKHFCQNNNKKSAQSDWVLDLFELTLKSYGGGFPGVVDKKQDNKHL